jgi:histidyl-tRNA synthetase
VTAADAELVAEVYPVVDRLRTAGLSVAYEARSRRLGRAIGQAAEKGSTYAVVLAPQEWAAGQVVVKNLRTGLQTAQPIDKLVEYFMS